MVLVVDGLGGQSALTATPAAITTTETVAHQLKIPPNDMQAGTTYRVKARGTISASAAGSLTAKLKLGTLGTTADTQVCAVGAAGSVTAAVGWKVEFDITIRTVGATGTALGNGDATVQATAPQLSPQTATVGVNTTVANFLSLTLLGAGTSPSITVTVAYVEIVKP